MKITITKKHIGSGKIIPGLLISRSITINLDINSIEEKIPADITYKKEYYSCDNNCDVKTNNMEGKIIYNKDQIEELKKIVNNIKNNIHYTEEQSFQFGPKYYLLLDDEQYLVEENDGNLWQLSDILY